MNSKGWLVTWKIEIQEASTPKEAAALAFEIVQRPGTWANCFTVKDRETGEETEIDLDEETSKFAVDIPQADRQDWLNVASFPTKEEAIQFAKEKFGADDEGKIQLITEY